MSDESCGLVRELIPDFVAGRLAGAELDDVRTHLVGCADCEADAELVQAVLADRPRVPSELLERLLSTVTTVRPRQTRTWWSAAAAAVAALALGIGLSSDPSAQVPTDVPGYAYEVGEGEIWVSDDGLLAGAPLFDDLSDDALLQLLDELSVGSAGGSA